MPGFVRAVNPRGVLFYEISVFVETAGSLSVRVKHFTPALAGWEAQDAYVDRPLVARDGDGFYFDGITFLRTGPDSFTVYFPRSRRHAGARHLGHPVPPEGVTRTFLSWVVPPPVRAELVEALLFLPREKEQPLSCARPSGRQAQGERRGAIPPTDFAPIPGPSKVDRRSCV